MRKALVIAVASSKAIKPVVATAWQYMKVEMPPPLTSSFFQGIVVEKMESGLSSAVDVVNNAMIQKIANIEVAQKKALQDKAAAMKLAEAQAKEKALAEAKAKAKAKAEPQPKPKVEEKNKKEPKKSQQPVGKCEHKKVTTEDKKANAKPVKKKEPKRGKKPKK